MIVYNVKRRWFPMKNDADAYRRAEGLPPAALAKLEIADRDDLSALLNALCGVPAHETAEVRACPAPGDVVERTRVADEVEVPDYIPAFLVKAWKQSQKGASE